MRRINESAMDLQWTFNGLPMDFLWETNGKSL